MTRLQNAPPCVLLTTATALLIAAAVLVPGSQAAPAGNIKATLHDRQASGISGMYNDFDRLVQLYQSQGGDMNEYTLIKCGWALTSVDYDYMAMVPNLDGPTMCGKCIKVTNEGSSASTYARICDQRDAGAVELGKAAFAALGPPDGNILNPITSISWDYADDSECSGAGVGEWNGQCVAPGGVAKLRTDNSQYCS